MSSSFYKPIEPFKGFRILVLEPAQNFDDNISCRLINVTTAKFPPYEALSYVWGKSTETLPILVQGQEVQIRCNLSHALRHLRSPKKSRGLWVDALCIDQANIEERNNHVQYMKEVYALCKRDLVWLGEKGEVLENARSAMSYLGGTIMSSADDGDDSYSDSKYEAFDAVQRLLGAPAVWSRIWIMQEIACAPSVRLVAEDETMEWDEVETFLDAEAYIEKFGIPSAYHAPFSHGMDFRERLQQSSLAPQILAHQRRVIRGTGIRTGYRSTLLDVLARFRHCQATDARDKIYGLLGLASDGLDVMVDYNRPVNDIYADVASRIIKHDNNLDLLTQGPWQVSSANERLAHSPSWIPCFEEPGPSRVLFAQRGIFNATGADESFHVSLLPNNTLELSGYHFAKLSWCGRSEVRAREKKGSTKDYIGYPPKILEWTPNFLLRQGIKNGNTGLKNFMDPRDTLPHVSPYSSNATALEAFWRTLSMDCKHHPLRRLDQDDMPQLKPVFTDFQMNALNSSQDLPVNFIYQVEQVMLHQRRFAVAANGVYCMVPEKTQVGDTIAVLHGGKVPVVLRPVDDSTDEFRWIGPCYVHEYMDGQILHAKQGAVAEKKTFRIV